MFYHQFMTNITELFLYSRTSESDFSTAIPFEGRIPEKSISE